MFLKLFALAERTLYDLVVHNLAHILADGAFPIASERGQLHGKMVGPVLGILLKEYLHIVDLLRKHIDRLVHLLTLVSCVFRDGALSSDRVEFFVVFGVAFSVVVVVIDVGGGTGMRVETTRRVDILLLVLQWKLNSDRVLRFRSRFYRIII